MTTYAPPQIQTNYDFARTVLTDAGLPATDNNVGNILRWITTENRPNNWFQGNNPLNLNTQGNADGYDRYSSIGEGAQRTAAFLNMPNYTAVKAVLAQNGSPADFSAAVVRSPWAESHYGVAAAGAAPKWIVQGRGLDYLAQIPLPPTYSYNGSQVGPAGSAGTSATLTSSGPHVGCSPSGGIDIFGAHIGTGCQIKALVGGLCVAAGAGFFIIGLGLIASRTKAGQAVLGAATGVGGRVGRAVSASRTASAPAEQNVPSEDYGAGFLAGQEAAGAAPPPRNRRQANRQAEDVFDRLGVSRPLGETAEPAF